MRKQFLQGLKRTASVGLTAVMLLSSGGTFLASGIGLTQVAAEETVIDSTEDTEHMESVDGTEDTERTGEALEAETGELPADGDIYPEPAATDLVSSFITDAALLADVQAILGKGSSATYQDMQNYSGAVNLDSFSNVQEIKNIEGIGGFYNATSFSFGKATQVTVIPNYTFANMTKLTSVTLPDSISEIGVQAFQKCTGLSEITLPSGLTKIGESAFEESALQKVDFSKCTALTTIGKKSFKRCSISSIEIPDTVPLTTVEAYAFDLCASLQSVYLPKSVKTIQICAFANCPKLQTFSVPTCCKIHWKAFCTSDSGTDKSAVQNLDLKLRPENNGEFIIPVGQEKALPIYTGESFMVDTPASGNYTISNVSISDSSAVSRSSTTEIAASTKSSVKIPGVNLKGEKKASNVTVTVTLNMEFYTYNKTPNKTMTITPSVTYNVTVKDLSCTSIEVDSDYYISKYAGDSPKVAEKSITITPVFKSGNETIIPNDVSWEYGNSKATITVAEDKLSARIQMPKSSAAAFEEIPITIKAGNQTKVVTVHVVTPITSLTFASKTINLPLVSGGSAGSITIAPSKVGYRDAAQPIKDRLYFESDNDRVIKVIDNKNDSCTVTALAEGTATITARSIAMRNVTNPSYLSKVTAKITVTVTDSGTRVELRDSGTGKAIANTITFDASKGQTTQTYPYVFVNSSGTETSVSGNDLDITVANSAVATVTPNTSAKTIAIKSLKYGTTTVTIAPKGKSENAVSYTISVPSNIKTINSTASITGNVGTTQTVFKSVMNSFGVTSANATPAKIKEISGNTVKFTSTNTNVASIDSNGTVSLKAKGSATVKMSVYASASATTPLLEKSVNVTVKQPVTGVSITSANGSNTVNAGDTLQLTAKVSPSNASDTSVTWSSSSTGIAKVSTAGLVTGVAAGTAVITAKANDGSNKSATFTVTVTKKVIKVTKISLSASTLLTKVGRTEKITATVTPTNADNRAVTWSSSAPTVASVDQSGNIIAKSVGNATITVTAKDGSGVTATCWVNVTDIKVTGITLNKTTLNIKTGATEQLTAKVQPTDATNSKVTWSSSVEGVATVDPTGKVTAIKAGTTVITATAKDDSGISASCTVQVTVPTVKVTGITLNKTTASVVKGKTVALTATVTPDTATDKTIKWTTSNKNVATVSTDGVVTAKAAGTATITATAADDSGVKATCKITVTNPVVKVTKVTLNKTTASVVKGKTLTLTATVTPTNATNKNVTWKSSNTKIATVDGNGKVTAVAAGTATITCTAKADKSKSATCKITVTNPAVKVTKLRMNKTSVDLLKGKTVQLKVTVTPSNATNKAVTWTSSNKRIATVTSNGLVKAVRTGTVTITAKAKDGSGKKVTCKINVYADSVESYVARIYTKALGRDPEPAGLKYWVGEIKAGRKTAVQVAEMFFFAPEFTNKKLNNKEYVKVLYRTFMGREADQGGLNYWIDRLNKGESRKSVLKAFAGCPEFKAIVKSFGL
ncbi:MAG: Ig-like domain-containing protein [Lachnospiraceae bacterium]|nr:Ig-like domain-containing protein [Lachnospiraceae bacterium]